MGPAKKRGLFASWLKGKSAVEEVGVVQRDMPNFFIEAVTVANGAIHSETREVIVPPEKRVLNVEVLPSQKEYLPGQKATVKVKLTDFEGRPFIGSTVVSVYDKSVEYISGGSNVPEIKEFFWKWRRSHNSQGESSLARYLGNILRQGERGLFDRFRRGVARQVDGAAQLAVDLHRDRDLFVARQLGVWCRPRRIGDQLLVRETVTDANAR